MDILSPVEVAQAVAARARDRRLARTWTQGELARRAGVALPTLKLFERTGKVSLERLARIAAALDDLDSFRALFAPLPAQSLDELEAQSAGVTRQRGRRRVNRVAS